MSDISEKSHTTVSETENEEVYIKYDSTMPETKENKLLPILNFAYSDITDNYSNDNKNILMESVGLNTDTKVSDPLNNEAHEIHDSTSDLTEENKYQKIIYSDKAIINDNNECTVTEGTNNDDVENMAIEATNNDDVENIATEAITNDIVKRIPIETINEETNNFDTSNSSIHEDDMISHKISVSNKTSSSLSAIAVEYDSDIDDEDIIYTDTNKSLDLNKSQNNENIEMLYCENTNVYRIKNEELSSKDSDSDNNSDSDDSSNSSDSSVIVIPNDSDENSDNETRR